MNITNSCFFSCFTSRCYY